MIKHFIDYYEKAKKMQELKFEKGTWSESDVDDPLVWNIPIYDCINRKYAAFSSLLEAVKWGSSGEAQYDPKDNGKYFPHSIGDSSFIFLLYWFRLCGSGINYKPKKGDEPWNSHGFGNFWIVPLLHKGQMEWREWLDNMPDKGFSDCKGYLLPMIKGGLRNFIQETSIHLVNDLQSFIRKGGIKGIKDVVDWGNSWLLERGFKRQNFVLTAFAMDMAEYFPHWVDRDSDTYVGSNAKKCLKQILPGWSTDKALRYLCNITGNFSKPYDMEDVACDFIRYMADFQSPEHVEKNGGIKYKKRLCI